MLLDANGKGKHQNGGPERNLKPFDGRFVARPSGYPYGLCIYFLILTIAAWTAHETNRVCKALTATGRFRHLRTRSHGMEQSHKSYRPLCVLTFRWNYLLHGLEPAGYHLVNVLLHTIVSLMYFR
ncbi:hypothetical protein ZHAS_00017889 [Anopheles sinensis]|uniref:Uncharacterized protein n=1 Tax=Anopheles sinensis TaxID=74873 RepID=A0A084WI20_ANOSI|nr:hypothetical protein ZHAS_00017889 [Anopheles sinensis]